MAKTVRKIEAAPAAPAKLKRVAAYARVSMETERLNHSLSAQVIYYSTLIQEHPGWVYAGMFADDGITGTKVNRPEFQRMLAECEAGNIDIILTKSISRFARNTVYLLETVRHLKELGIEVQFEKEHISSLSDDGELMLSLLASFAQEEVRSLSENVKWGTRKRMQQGIPNGHFRVYGYRWEGDELGFAILENMVILVGSIANVSILWAFVRGFGAARMHSACTSLVGTGIGYVHKRRKLFFCGTIALLISAIIAHGLFNLLIQAEHRWAAYAVILFMHTPQLLNICKSLFTRNKSAQASMEVVEKT